MPGRLRAIVVGAGAFGGWTALMLRRAGAEVTLVDSWGPGHARASSGGATRVLRLSYPRLASLRLARRARELWLEEERRSGRRLFNPTGLLWLAADFCEVERAVMANLRAEAIPFEQLDPHRLAVAYPQVRSDDLSGAILEPGAGYLLAAEACRAVAEALQAEGGTYRVAWAAPGAIRGGELTGLVLSDGSRPSADVYVFAGGPWLATTFADRLGGLLRVTRQEVYTFGTPAGDLGYGPDRLPVWAFNGDRFWYGVPGAGPAGGFKLADDSRGPIFDPTTGDRLPSAEGLERARAFLADRFPGLSGAPLIEARVCQYSQTPDGRFLADRHPEAANAWLVGGGSGHGFKHGPAVGEHVAALVRGERAAGDGPAFRTLAEPGDGP